MVVGPSQDGIAGRFGAVVAHHRLGLAACTEQPVEPAADAEAEIDQRQAFAGKVVDHHQDAQAPAADELVGGDSVATESFCEIYVFEVGWPILVVTRRTLDAARRRAMRRRQPSVSSAAACAIGWSAANIARLCGGSIGGEGTMVWTGIAIIVAGLGLAAIASHLEGKSEQQGDSWLMRVAMVAIVGGVVVLGAIENFHG